MFADVLSALAFLTILPVPWMAHDDSSGRIFAYFPLVGLILGAILAVVASIRFLPPDLTTFLVLLVWGSLTGGLHLDGLADSCDGLLATTTTERRLEIMKDPRAGSWAVIGIALVLLGKWIALRSLPPLMLILPPILGRWAMVLAVAGFPTARTAGSAVHFRQGFGPAQLIVATLISLISVPFFGWCGILSVLAAGLVVGVFGRWASARLGGGLTGDVYGAVCELVELMCLILLNLG